MLNSSLNELLYDKNADEIEQIFEKAQNPQIGKVTDPTDTENMEQLSYIKAKKFVDMILQKVISLKGQTDALKKQLSSAESQEDIEKLLGDNTGIIDLNFLNTLTRKDMTGNVNINPVNLRKGKDQIEGAKSEDVSGYHKGSQIIPVVLEVDGSSVGVGESFYVALIPAIGSAIRPENENLHRAVFGIEIPEGETTIWTDVEEIPIVMVNGESELEDLKKGALTSGNQSLTKFKTLSLKLNQRKTQQPTETKETFNLKGTMIHEQYSLSDAFLVTEHISPSNFMKACINSIRKKYYKKNNPKPFEVEDIKIIFNKEYKKLTKKDEIENFEDKLKSSKGLIINTFQEGEKRNKILRAFEDFVKEKVSPSQSAASTVDVESTNDGVTLSVDVQKRQPESSEQEVESSEEESTEGEEEGEEVEGEEVEGEEVEGEEEGEEVEGEEEGEPSKEESTDGGEEAEEEGGEASTETESEAEEEEAAEDVEKEKTIDDIELDDIRKLLDPFKVSDNIDVTSFKRNYLDIDYVKKNFKLWEAGCKNESDKYERVNNVEFQKRLKDNQDPEVWTKYDFYRFESDNKHINNLLACDYAYILNKIRVGLMTNKSDFKDKAFLELGQMISKTLTNSSFYEENKEEIASTVDQAVVKKSESGEIKQAKEEQESLEQSKPSDEVKQNTDQIENNLGAQQQASAESSTIVDNTDNITPEIEELLNQSPNDEELTKQINNLIKQSENKGNPKFLETLEALNIQKLDKKYRKEIVKTTNNALQKACLEAFPGTSINQPLIDQIMNIKMDLSPDDDSFYDSVIAYNKNLHIVIFKILYNNESFGKYVLSKNKEAAEEKSKLKDSYDIFANNKLSTLLFENNGNSDDDAQQISDDDAQQINDEANSIANQITLEVQRAQLELDKMRAQEEIDINAEIRNEQMAINREQYQIARITQYQDYSALEHRIQTRIAQCIGDLETSILNIKERQLDRERSEDAWLSRQGLFGEYDKDLSLRDGHVRNFFIGGGNFLSNLAGKSIGSIVRLAGKDATKKVVGASLASGAVTAAGSSIGAALSGFSAVASAGTVGAGGTAALTALGGLASSIAIGLPGIAIGAYVSYKAYEAIADHLNDEQSRNRLVTSNQRSIDRKRDQIAIDRAKSESKRQIATLNSVLVEVCSRLKAIRGNELFTKYIQNNAGDTARIQDIERHINTENYNMFARRSLSELIFEEVDKKEDSISWNDIKNILSKDKYFSDLLKNDKNNFIAGSIYTLIEDITGCGSQIKGLPAFDTKNYSKELYNQYIPKEVSVGQPMIPSSKAMRQSQSTFVGMPKTGDDSCSVIQILNILNNGGRRDLMISFLSSLSDTSGEKQYFKEGDSLNSTMKAMSSDKDLEKNVRSEAKQVAKESNKIISDIRVGLFRIKQSDHDKLLKLENMFINLDTQAEVIQKTLDGLGLKVKDKVKADILPESGRQQVLDYFCEIVDDNKAEKNLTLDFVYNYMKNIINIEFVIDLGDKKQLPINEEDVISLIMFNSALSLLMKVEDDEKKTSKFYKKSSQVHKYVFKDLVGKIKQLKTDDDDQHKKLIGITSKGKELKLERSFVYKSGIKNLLD